jgi:DNA-binding transcriptional regulator GbsR (MarR family)
MALPLSSGCAEAHAMITLGAVVKKFVLHWGELGQAWGVNRTVAQIHALLFVSARPLNAEEIAEALDVARSNVSTSLKELQGWGIVKRVHVLGDRRDHFESLQDVWEMFRIVVEQRKKRECDPTLAVLRECTAAAAKAGPSEQQTRRRLGRLLEFFETMNSAYEQARKLPTSTLLSLLKTGGRLRALFG